jgi:hypothetical protein
MHRVTPKYFTSCRNCLIHLRDKCCPFRTTLQLLLIPTTLVSVIRRIQSSPNLNSSPAFSLMSYNILAECYCDNMRYFYCPAYAVLWEYRISLICREIEGFRPDIFCLQVRTDAKLILFVTHPCRYCRNLKTVST